MDLLERYKDQHPEMSREQKPQLMQDLYGREYTGMTALVMRLSGGMIQNNRHAFYVLLTIIGISMALSLLIFFSEKSPALQARERAFLDQGKTPAHYDQTLFNR